MRLRHNPIAVPELEKHEDKVLFKPQSNRGKWKDFFGNNNPIYLELGMGRGQFISINAQNNPNINYIGMEKKNEVVLKAFKKIKNKELNNIILIPININYILDVFGQSEIDKLYINFCDPWPKDRHAKRRLTHRLFLNMYKNLLNENGTIEFKTDNLELFDYSLLEFKEADYSLSHVTYDLASLNDPNNVETEYEQKFMSMGTKICRLKAEL